jgi:transcriptional regulator with XRE-family HTH domain
MPREPRNLPGPLAREATEAVRRHMSRQGVSGLELAKRIGISQNYIARRLRHEASFTFNDVENIAMGLRIPIADLVPGRGTAESRFRDGDRAAVVSMAGPDTARDEGTQRMSVRIDELFENLPPVLSVTDLTRILGKDRTTVYRWLRKGEVPGVLIDTTWIIYRDEVRDYLLSRHNQAGGAPRVQEAAPEDRDPGGQEEHSELQDESPSA